MDKVKTAATNMRFTAMLADGRSLGIYTIIIKYRADGIVLDFRCYLLHSFSSFSCSYQLDIIKIPAQQ